MAVDEFAGSTVTISREQKYVFVEVVCTEALTLKESTREYEGWDNWRPTFCFVCMCCWATFA